MSQSRRDFLKTLGVASLGSIVASCRFDAASRITPAVNRAQGRDSRSLAADESYWSEIRSAYQLSDTFTNIESGYYNAAVQSTIESQVEHLRSINRDASFYMRGDRKEEYKDVKRELANFAGCRTDEIAITRNTTESLNAVILGIKLEPGQEIIYSNLEYPSMVQALEMRSQRYGTPIRKFDIPAQPTSAKELVAHYANAIGPRTKVLLISHVVFSNGMVTPVREIARLAHDHGIEVICDAAHSFAHVNFRIPDLECDYVGTSLHKWLGAPLGTGLLYIKKDKIPRVWPLFGDTEKSPKDIEKFEHLGTRPPHTYLAIKEAIRFNQTIGLENKEWRLRHLKNLWVNQVRNLPRVRINGPTSNDLSCAICNFSIAGQDAQDTQLFLMKRHKVFTVALKKQFGVRVSVNLFNSPQDIERLVTGIQELSRRA